MASLIQGYEYDIFISYRQKDNKGDRWVTEFVEALKVELESTFKDEVSVYFDINPHDGLLETHDVAASLKEKLKCLVFIPVISQTFCDSKSFAWEYEFCAFNKMAKEDQFGRDIKLAGGNVASRILPVKIHDLDTEDQALLKNELGSVLRSIEFIYKSPGVNRPLRASEDHPQDNLNKTYYRDQINKVANAVKEIIIALMKYDKKDFEVPVNTIETKKTPLKNLKTRILTGSFFAMVLLVLGYFVVPKLSGSFGSDAESIVVLPFENSSSNKDNYWLSDGIAQDIMMQLYNISGIFVRMGPSNYQYKGTGKTISQIGKELKANYWISGSVQKDSDQISIKVILNNTVSNTQLAIEPIKYYWKDFQNAQAELTKQIADKLNKVLTPVEIRRIYRKMTDEPKAYQLYATGMSNMLRAVSTEEKIAAMKYFEDAIGLDPKFCMAYMSLSKGNLMLYQVDKDPGRILTSKAAIDSALKCDPEVAKMPSFHNTLAMYYYSGFQDIPKAMEEINIAERLSKNKFINVELKAAISRRLGEWKMAKENYMKTFELSPNYASGAYYAAVTLYLVGDYQEAEKHFKSSIKINPTYVDPYWQWILMEMKWNGNTIKGREILSEAFQFEKTVNDPQLIESKVLMDIYDGNYESALSYLSSKKIDVILTPMYLDLKSLLYARIYNLMNVPEKANAYFDSARVEIERSIVKSPDDSRLHGALGIAYAGLGLKGKAIEEGAKAVALLPMNKDTYFGIYRVEDLARIYVMVGDYDKALEQIRYLLSHPGPLSVKMLQLDPAWKPLREMPEFRKIIKRAPADNSRI
jgi:TolB-like protein/Tfp pilus assembly protein PilF